jgi:hypothetical protein
MDVRRTVGGQEKQGQDALEEHRGLLGERGQTGFPRGRGGELVQYKAEEQFPLGLLCLV